MPASPQENAEWNLTNSISLAFKYILCLANYYWKEQKKRRCERERERDKKKIDEWERKELKEKNIFVIDNKHTVNIKKGNILY